MRGRTRNAAGMAGHYACDLEAFLDTTRKFTACKALRPNGRIMEQFLEGCEVGARLGVGNGSSGKTASWSRFGPSELLAQVLGQGGNSLFKRLTIKQQDNIPYSGRSVNAGPQEKKTSTSVQEGGIIILSVIRQSTSLLLAPELQNASFV